MGETYRRWRLPELWQMIAADNPTDAHLHLATLRRQQTALETQRDRLRSLRGQLTEAWPPEKSEAATAFVQQVNDMIDAIMLTARGAGELRSNLVHVVDAIASARAELEPLVADYERANAVVDARVGTHAQRILDDRARRILVDADSTVAQAVGNLDVPLPNYARFSLGHREESSSTVTSTTAPPGTSGGNGAGVGSLARTVLSTPRFDPPTPALGQDAYVLAGVQHVVDSNIAALGTQLSGPPPGIRSGVVGGGPSDGIFGGGLVLRGPARVSADATGSGTEPPPSTGRPASVGPPTGHLMPGAGAVGRPLTSSHFGGSAAAAQRAHGYRDQSFEAYAARRRDPQVDQGDTWSVKEGVTPLIAPTSWDRDHDPGPGVLGIDR